MSRRSFKTILCCLVGLSFGIYFSHKLLEDIKDMYWSWGCRSGVGMAYIEAYHSDEIDPDTLYKKCDSQSKRMFR